MSFVNSVVCGSCLDVMAEIPYGSADGVITSPPYNLGNNPNHRKKDSSDYSLYKSYSDSVDVDEYLDFTVGVFNEYSRIINNRGVICYNLSYSSKNPMLMIHAVSEVDKSTDFTLVDMVVWKKKSVFPLQTSPLNLSRICEPIFIFCKKAHVDDFITNKKVAKVNEKTDQKFYAYYDNLIEANNNDGIKCDLQASFSTDLVSGLLDIYFPEGSVILDNFMGIGTTPLACAQHGRKYIGIDIEQEYVDIAKKRLSKVQLKFA